MNAIKDWLIVKAYAADTSFDFTNLITPLSDSDANVSTLANKVLGWIFLVAGILAVIYLVYAGIVYITAGGNADAAKKGQQGIINAIIGIVIIVLAYVIVVAVGDVLA